MSSQFVVIWLHLLRIAVCKSANSIKRSEVPSSAVAAAGIYLQCVIYSHMKSLIFYVRKHADVGATSVQNVPERVCSASAWHYGPECCVVFPP